ncbi:MAG: hypothetical protein ACRY3E_04620, partial [Candidatus Lariskella arthropodorum]
FNFNNSEFSFARVDEIFMALRKKGSTLLATSLLSLVYITSGATVTFLPEFFLKSGNHHLTWYFLLFSICMVLPRLFIKKNMSTGAFPFDLLLGCTLINTIGNLANWLFASTSYIYIGAICNGITLGVIYPTIMSYVVCVFPRNMTGTCSSIVASAADIGVIGANLLLGLMSILLSLKTAMLIPAISSGIALSMILISRIRIFKLMKLGPVK